MTKQEAQAHSLFWDLAALNHPVTCACHKTPKGVAMIHYGKTEQEYNDMLALAEG